MTPSGATYDRDYALSRSTPSDNWLFDEIIKLLQPQPCWRVLDVGCNTGELAGRLAEQGCDTLGIDISPDAILVARQRFPKLRFVAGELPGLAESGFDAIVSSHVIEHLADPAAFLSAAHERLKPGGVLLLVTPNRQAFLHRLLHAMRGIPIFHDPTHQRLYARFELRQSLHSAGFRSVRATSRMLYFPWASRLPVSVRLRIPCFGMGDHLFLFGRTEGHRSHSESKLSSHAL
jgi:2-polyprenyl-3-methyl-5-hydroxy-6-metoxy-1,4-benzoquinol methylase